MSPPTDDQAPPSGQQPKPAGESQPTPGSDPGPGQPPPGASPGPGGTEGSAGERIQAIISAAEKAAAGIIEDADAQARRYIDTSRQRADALADERVRVMSDLTETLVRQADLVRRQSDQLLSALDSARNELAGQIGKELTQGSPAETAAASATVSQAAPAPAAAPEAPASQPPPGASRLPHLQPVESKPPDLKPVESAPEPAPAAEEGSKPVESAPEPAPPVAQPVSEPPPAPPPPAAPPIASVSKEATPSDGARLLAAQMAVAGSSRDEIEARLRKEFGIEDAGPILDGILGPG